MSNGPSAIREQKERASVLKNEQKLREGEPATLFARARAGLDDEDVPGGRYAAQAHLSAKLSQCLTRAELAGVGHGASGT